MNSSTLNKRDKYKVEWYVLIKKIGQYPSMKDMQFFEYKEYKNIGR